MLTTLLCALGAYLLGSLSAAIIVCKIMGLPDPRSGGSGNPGATNVLRLGGKKAAALTLCGDVLKGLLAVIIVKWLGLGNQAIAAAALGAFLGHLYPAFFGFRGGKGVATAFGAIAGLSPMVALAALLVWLATSTLTRISSLSALVAAISCPVWLWWFELPPIIIASVLIMVGLLIWRHRANIQRIARGTESRIGQRSSH